MTRRLTRTIHAPLFAAALALGLISAMPGARAADSDTPHVMTVTGEGQVNVVPDTAVIQTGVITEGKTAAEALAANTKSMSAMFAGLADLKIAKKDMQTSNFSVYPVYDNAPVNDSERTVPTIQGYRVSNQLSVVIRDLDSLGGVLDKLVTLGSNQIGGISFSVDKPEQHLDKARADAVVDALRKAKIYAGAAGVALGEIVTINENGGGMPQPMYMKSMMRSEAADVPMAAGEQTISSSVTLTIAIQ